MTYKRWEPYAYIAPVLVLFAVFFIFPFFYSLFISFNDWNILTGDKTFVGLKNYRTLFASKIFGLSIRNTLLYVFTQMPCSVILGFLYAVLIEKSGRAKVVYRLLFFIPVVISVSAASLSFLTIFNTMHGPLNAFLKLFGITGPNWLNSPKSALPAIIIIGVWQSFGYNVILYMSGLKQIDGQLYEAADLDGASALRKTISITLPLLSPVSFFVIVITTLSSFQVFATVQILTNGGPNNASTVWVFYIWREAFRYFETSTASSAATLLFVFMLAATFVLVRHFQKTVFYK
ncbi:carbohydrate ABC transporter permease [Sediminispirochaeta smaragdinae]|uniref:Binding-protein-dependent transport systems inner membrane component n=1 Tax=Sediminispirochaeta smaragdinae (strain DSM 11293 / JCM 15392 / SEBR 4228) TaxID=573413 RepID=E1RBP6_SEDSS|nr:sugar ABC transporter permease [Sediminispirochaeta smaragdinae]ADK79776.1 binding-protein-dependent transport systems inner membrane component [Sediminispirochaeta smaragdinae DSM 11293]